MKYNILFTFLALFLVLPPISAVNLESGTVLNTTTSNTSITFLFMNVTVDQVIVDTRYINMTNLNYSSGIIFSNITTSFTHVNQVRDSSAFPRATSVSPTTITITSSLSQGVNATVIFTVSDCDSVGTILFTPASGGVVQRWHQDGYTCASRQISLDLQNINSGSNLLSISYDNSLNQLCNDELSGLQNFGNFIPLMIIVLVGGTVVLFIYNKMDEGMADVQDGSVGIIIAVVIVGMGAAIIFAVLNSSC